MLASCNIRTCRAMLSLAAVNYNTATHCSTLFPVMGFITVPSGRRCVCAGRNSCSVCNDFITAKALGIAGVACNLILVIGFACIYSSSAAGMIIRVCIAIEGTPCFTRCYLSADFAGTEIDCFVLAGTGCFQSFRFLLIGCVLVICKRTKWDFADRISFHVKALSTVIAPAISIPALFCTGGRLFANICLVRVGARSSKWSQHEAVHCVVRLHKHSYTRCSV